MKKFKISTLFIVSFLFVFSSCSVDKKMYSSGYHVEWYKNAATSQKQKTAIAAKTPKQKNNLIQKNIFPETIITKGKSENKFPFFVAQNAAQKNNFLEKNGCEKLKTLRVDSLKSESQKINSTQNNNDKKWKEITTLSTISMVLGVLLFLLYFLFFSTSVLGIFSVFMPILAGILFIGGLIVLGAISSHIKQKTMNTEENKQKEKKSKTADLIAGIVMACLFLVVLVGVIVIIFRLFL